MKVDTQEWPEIAFEELYAEPSRNGLTRPKRVRGTGEKMVNMKELFAYDRINGQDMELVPLNDTEAKKFLLQQGDLLFARQSLVLEGAGKCSLVLATPEPTTFESHLIRVRLNTKLTNPEFYYYYFSSPSGKGKVQSLVNQVAAAGIRGSELAKLKIVNPPLEQQQKIASILSAYDDLIENNNRRIAILEEMARRLYREWFIKFRFPGHEEIKMVDSELREIPEGWEVVSASDAIDINPRTSLPREGEKPYLGMQYLSETSMVIQGKEYRTGNSGTKFCNGDTLFARITPSLENGKTGFVQFLDEENPIGFGSTEFIVLRSKTFTPEFVYCLARSNSFRENAIKSMTGATGRQRVQNSCFDTYHLAQPTEDVLKKFSKAVRPFFHLVHTLHKKNENLREQRDMLLPKLISGKIELLIW